jgi:hypothetical protein
MILQRMAKAFRRQDWSAVALELVIVVVGIFLGLRVDDWNTARKERAEETRYLVQLADDVGAMRAEVESLLDRAEEHRAITLRAIRALQGGETGPEARSAVAGAIVAYQNSPPFIFKRATYDEMVSTGALARLPDHDLKRRVSSTFAALDRLGTNIDRFRVSLPVVDAVVWTRVTFGVDDDGAPTVRVDLDRLGDDVEFRNAVVEMLDIHWDVGTSYRRVLPALDSLSAVLPSGPPLPGA